MTGDEIRGIEERLRSRFADVPGLVLDEVVHEGMRVTSSGALSSSSPPQTVIRVAGWSASLHHARMTWRVPARMGVVVLTPDDVARAIGEHIDIQRVRAEAGAAIGHAQPLPRGIDKDIEVGHIQVDRSLATLLAEAYGGVLQAVRQGVWIHNGTDHDGAQTIMDEDWTLDGTIFQEEMVLGLNGNVSVYDGKTLTIQEMQMPDTVLAAAVGRGLGEIVELPARAGPELAARRIVSADQDDLGVHLEVEPMLATVDQLLREAKESRP